MADFAFDGPLSLLKNIQSYRHNSRCLEHHHVAYTSVEKMYSAEMDEISAGAAETTATLLSGIFLLLRIHPEKFERLEDIIM